MRQDITFTSGPDVCAGWFYMPEGATGDARFPVVVMAPGFSAVKEWGLNAVAERFCAAGHAVLLFDFRHFGASGGMPRSQLFPQAMVEDYRNAISWVCRQPRVDQARLGVWGTSFSGGVATHVATVDRRVKAVVAQVPSLLNAETRRNINPARWEAVGAFLQADRIARYETGDVRTLPVVAADGEPCALPGQESRGFFVAASASTPTWRNEITVESLEKIGEFDPVSLIHMLAPTALLVIAAEKDSLIPLAALTKVVDRAAEPKRIAILPAGHFEVYSEPWFSTATNEAVIWFRTHL